MDAAVGTIYGVVGILLVLFIFILVLAVIQGMRYVELLIKREEESARVAKDLNKLLDAK